MYISLLEFYSTSQVKPKAWYRKVASEYYLEFIKYYKSKNYSVGAYNLQASVL